MSYEISLYEKSFPERALATGLGDWRGADPIPDSAAQAIVEAVLAEGFLRSEIDPSFQAFLQERGASPAVEFGLDSKEHLAQLSLHRGQIAFSIPYSERAEASILLCQRIARQVASVHGLAYWDPQVDQE